MPDAAREPVATPTWPRVVAGTVLALQAVALLGFATWEVWRSRVEEPSNAAVAAGSTAYFFTIGALLALVAVQLWRGRGWTHGAGVFVQLLALPVAWTMATADFWAGALLLGGAALAALAALVSPAGRSALGR